MTPWVIAHRGLAKRAPESTLAAFIAAGAAGAHAVELDVHMSRDGALIVMHDEAVDRTSDGSGQILDLSSSEIRRLDAGSWFGEAFVGERVPLLEEVLALEVKPIIELKHGSERYPGIEQELVTLLRSMGRDRDAVLISGNVIPLATVARIAPELPRLLFSTSTLTPSFRLEGMEAAAVLFAPPEPGLSAVITAARKQGRIVLGTTLGAALDTWQAYLPEQITAGVSGFFTDDVEELALLLVQT